MERLHQPREIINKRYRILHTLGQGGVGITYAAVDLQSGEQVALKALSLRRMNDWKKLELFEREARILSQLNHPAIPRYLDYFQVETPTDRYFYIAQELVPGKSLATLVESGWKPSAVEVGQIARQILEILIYLHSLTPAVIHRDIKPQNIVRRNDGQVYLVDFGAVQDTYHNTVTGGSTVVGTYGYMAPEQFRGQAVPSTDLYGLGTTVLFLLTGFCPADLPQRKLKIDFRPHVHVCEGSIINWLEQMLEPAIADRFPSAKVALATLLGQTTLKPQRVQNSPIILSKTDHKLVVEIPPGYTYNNYSLLFLLVAPVSIGIFGLILWVLLIYFNVISILLILLFIGFFLGLPFGIILIYLGFMLLLFVVLHFSNLLQLGLFLLLIIGRNYIDFVLRPILRRKLMMNHNTLYIQQWLLGWNWRKQQIPTSNIKSVKLKSIAYFKFCQLEYWNKEGRLENIKFGEFLKQSERKWLVWEMNNFLNK